LRGHLTNEAINHFVLLAEQGRVLMSRLRLDPLSYGLIHADLHAGNCLFRHDGVAFIDFRISVGVIFSTTLPRAVWFDERLDYFDLTGGLTTAYARIARCPQISRTSSASFRCCAQSFYPPRRHRHDPRENAWWEGYVVSKLRRLLHS